MGIVPKTGELIGNIIGWIKSADIGGAAKTTWDTITNIVTNPWDAIKNNPFMKGITKGFVGAADATQSVAGSALDYTYNKVIGPSNLKGGETTGTVTGATPNITGMQDVQEMIKKNEGFRENAYKDASGKSIGYGHFIKKGENLTKITLDQAEKLFEGDFKTAVDNAQNIPGFSSLNKKGQAALIDMTYNMGVNWWKGNAKTGKGRWNNLIKGLESKDYELVEKSIKDSNYYKQVPKSRTSTNISNILSNSSRNGGYNLSSNQMQQKINIEGSSLELSNSTIEKLADKITEGYKNSMPKKTGTTVSVQPVGRG
jgi:GH24 family phage-related lysozyme (muramidase)